MNGSPFTIFVNDEPRRLPGAATVAALAADLGVANRQGVAIAVNGGVVARLTWANHDLQEGDHVLVIRATQGG